MLASTTGNIYGVYDMSGGAVEYTMSNLVDTDGTTMLHGDSDYTTTTYPDAKYYDKYSYSKSYTSRKRSKLGDGIKEVYKGSGGWYDDGSELGNKGDPWFRRSGSNEYGSGAGLFLSSYGDGDYFWGVSSRLIIMP